MLSILTVMSGTRLAGNRRIKVPSAHPNAAVILRPLVNSRCFSQIGQTARLRGGSSGMSSRVPQSAQAIVMFSHNEGRVAAENCAAHFFQMQNLYQLSIRAGRNFG
jgi:hypothetical protein